MVSYEFMYGGGGYNMGELAEPIDAGLNYSIKAGQLGFPTSIQNVNQIQEITNALSTGVKAVEMQPIQQGIFEQIPKQHFKEIRRLTELTGAEPTLHAPMIEPSGFVENQWSESNQISAEEQLKDVVEKAHELNPKGNIPVTIHCASSVPGEQIVPDGEGGYKSKTMFAVDRTSGQIKAKFEEEEMAYPEQIAEEGKAEMRTPKQRLDNANYSQWINRIESLQGLKKSVDEVDSITLNQLNQLNQQKQQAKEIANMSNDNLAKQAFNMPYDNLNEQQKQALISEKQQARVFSETKDVPKEIQLQMNKSELFLQNTQTSFRSMFDEAYRYSGDESKKKLKKIADKWVEDLNGMGEKIEKLGGNDIEKSKNFIRLKSQILDEAMIKLQGVAPPQTLESVEDFSTDKAAKTLANVAMHGYKKFGENAPIVSIENMHPGMAFSKPEAFKKLINETKKEFIEKAVSEGISENKARKIADRQIGVTWDVGHINMMRKQGFKEEDIIEATKLMGKDIKHVHLTDNFGFSDSHLSPGMGNVPIKKILETMEKNGVNLRDIKMINEAGAFAAGYKVNPHPYLLAAFDSPMFAAGAVSDSTWGSAGAYPGYFAGYGTMLPEQHFSMYGAGFSGLPTELGGQVGGGRSRMSGAPNA